MRMQCPVKDADGKDASDVCRVCSERISRSFDQASEQWMFVDAVRIQGSVFHAACQADAVKVVRGCCAPAMSILKCGGCQLARRASDEPAADDGQSSAPLKKVKVEQLYTE